MGRRAPRAFAAALAAAAFAGAAARSAPAQPLGDALLALARGEAAYAARHAGADEAGRARPEPIAEAVDAFADAVAAAPDALAARWRLVRALFFAADFASGTSAEADRQLDRATAEAEAAKDALAARVGGRDALDALEPEALRDALPPEEAAEAASLYFWSAVAWAAWGREHGVLSAVREGLAGRIHRDAQTALVLDETVEEGGPLRLLARLHATLPRVPFLSGWVDPAQSLPALERALEVAPSHPGNRMLYALTLLEQAPERREEALALLEELASLEPRAWERTEDLALRRSARERLAEEGERAD
jgi:tetratricopeptide (TPR) repeat protein